jgi:hypothetical protein
MTPAQRGQARLNGVWPFLFVIAGKRAKHFDPDVVDAFLAHVDDFDRIRVEMQDEHAPAPSNRPSAAVS